MHGNVLFLVRRNFNQQVQNHAFQPKALKKKNCGNFAFIFSLTLCIKRRSRDGLKNTFMAFFYVLWPDTSRKKNS
jgi:hypothetical protein